MKSIAARTLGLVALALATLLMNTAVAAAAAPAVVATDSHGTVLDYSPALTRGQTVTLEVSGFVAHSNVLLVPAADFGTRSKAVANGKGVAKLKYRVPGGAPYGAGSVGLVGTSQTRGGGKGGGDSDQAVKVGIPVSASFVFQIVPVSSAGVAGASTGSSGTGHNTADSGVPAYTGFATLQALTIGLALILGGALLLWSVRARGAVRRRVSPRGY